MAKKFIPVFPFMEKPKWTFWSTQYLKRVIHINYCYFFDVCLFLNILQSDFIPYPVTEMTLKTSPVIQLSKAMAVLIPLNPPVALLIIFVSLKRAYLRLWPIASLSTYIWPINFIFNNSTWILIPQFNTSLIEFLILPPQTYPRYSHYHFKWWKLHPLYVQSKNPV